MRGVSVDNPSDTQTAAPAMAQGIRDVLAGLPRLRFVGTSEVAAILRRDVVRAGIDPLRVRELMVTVGGYEGETYLRRPRLSAARDECRTPLRPEPYFAIPLATFEAPDARAA